ncbi:MAG TPA: type II toxin-antitoxin system VapC family toxin [Rhizomicrobium sp.]|jgi:tRNA(fMet)-specific endonuclease VapC
MIYMLDTNIVSDAIRNPHGSTAMRVLQAGVDRVCTSIIVAAEIRFGIVRREASGLAIRLDEFFTQIEVMPFQQPADIFYAEIRTDLERSGKLIGPNDLLIAAHALALDCTLVTDNTKEFSRVSGLKIENWLR